MESVCFKSYYWLCDAFSSAQFFLAGVTALVVSISHVDQVNDLIFGNEGSLKGLMKLLHLTLNMVTCHFIHIQNTTLLICRIAQGCCHHSPFNLITSICPKSGKASHRQFTV